MTVLPFLETKATPICPVESPPTSRRQSFPRIPETDNASRQQSPSSNKIPASPKLSSLPLVHTRTPKIKIVPRSDEILKRLPHAKTTGIRAHNHIWKPLVREPADYDYLWEPLQREDMRHQYDCYIASQRITASRPDEPLKMSSVFETEDRHFHNYQRVQAMQQRQWNREHMQYTVYPYSELVERERYKKNIRSTLQDQIKEKAQANKDEQDMKSRETHIAILQDKQDLEQEKQNQIQRTSLLLQVTAKNKELMENKWEYDQWNRVHQWHVDRAILADNPLNWSQTMT